MFRHLPVTSLADTTHNFEQLQGILNQAPEVAFPTNPVEGQVFYYSPAVGTTWSFKYNATSTSSHKWQFVGGPSLVAGPSGSMSKKTETNELLTGSPSMTVPLAGEYEVGLKLTAATTEAGLNEALGYIREGSTILSSVLYRSTVATANERVMTTNFERFQFATATVLTVAVGIVFTHTTLFGPATLSLVPVRVG